MNERQLTRIEVEAEHAEDLKSLKLVKEIRRTRATLRRYLRAHVRAVQAVGTKDNPDAGAALWRAYYAAWASLGEVAPEVDQLY